MEYFREVDYTRIKKQFSQARESGNHMQLFDSNARFWIHQERIKFDQVREMFRFLGDARDFIIAQGNYKGLYLFSEKSNRCFKYDIRKTEN